MGTSEYYELGVKLAMNPILQKALIGAGVGGVGLGAMRAAGGGSLQDVLRLAGVGAMAGAGAGAGSHLGAVADNPSIAAGILALLGSAGGAVAGSAAATPIFSDKPGVGIFAGDKNQVTE